MSKACHVEWLVTPDGTRIVCVALLTKLCVCGICTLGRQCIVFEGHEGKVTEVAVTPDSSKVVSSSEDGIRVWDLSTGMEVLAMESPGIRSMVITKDGSQIVTCSGRSAVRMGSGDGEAGDAVALLCGVFACTGSHSRWMPCCFVL